MRITRLIFALLLVSINGLITGCDALSPVPTPPVSEYPADIIGKVTIAGFLKNYSVASSEFILNPKANNVFWVVNISIKNKTYLESIPHQHSPWTYWKWAIEAGTNVYKPPEIFKVVEPQILTLPKGQTGQMSNCFEVPSSLSLSNAKIVYQGQQPYSYGQLTGGEKAAGYDFFSNKTIKASRSTKVATVERIWVSAIWVGGGGLFVELKPTSSAIANKVYTVELYEKGKLRATVKVSWNQPEINVSTMKPVKFPATRQEAEA